MSESSERVASELDAHERECALRYQMIETQLEDGKKRFARLETMIWGLYALMITSTVLSQVLK